MHCYLVHRQDDQERFFAVMDVMKEHSIDNYGVPHVTRDNKRQFIAVASVYDILGCVGLVRYSDNTNNYKVIMPYARYAEKIGNRHNGTYADLRVD
ncbi:hypothetical protein [Nesterenkonia halophila]